MQIAGKIWENFEIFWWKFYRKIEFYIFRKFVTKNRAVGNNTIFSNNLFGFGGFPPSSGYTLGLYAFISTRYTPILFIFTKTQETLPKIPTFLKKFQKIR